jgi:hypothetical protein
MKNHVHERKRVSLHDLEGDPAGIADRLMAYVPDDAIDAYFEIEWHYDDVEGVLVYWRPMTEKELEKAKATRKKEREAKKAAKEAKEAAERAEYERLKAKFE